MRSERAPWTCIRGEYAGVTLPRWLDEWLSQWRCVSAGEHEMLFGMGRCLECERWEQRGPETQAAEDPSKK